MVTVNAKFAALHPNLILIFLSRVFAEYGNVPEGTFLTSPEQACVWDSLAEQVELVLTTATPEKDYLKRPQPSMAGRPLDIEFYLRPDVVVFRLAGKTLGVIENLAVPVTVS
jgi:hypothetical protein